MNENLPFRLDIRMILEAEKKTTVEAATAELDHLDSTMLQDCSYPYCTITKFAFPRTLKDIRMDGIDKGDGWIISIEEDLGDVLKECSRDTSDKVERITSGRKNNVKKFDIDQNGFQRWIVGWFVFRP
ncbi:hypothetical protein INT45_013880 [Circinella minor]|uniref:Uncharacterized protein n=1 Tax=Circinella minor TaxID=1195481 RepID=A0A8H7RV51_9FUNG|nr:hypothetical protein INT45_013880 [Circinella minor]